MKEPRETRIKRLKMRSMRRGIKEMDVILQPFAEANLEAMDEAGLRLYDDMLSENDHDLYQWVSRQTPAPDRYAALIDQIVDQLPRGSV
ncbi:succinate dehydrogenase assembly factor 2 [Roseobacter sp.]|uniref:succinate dehydrogenase assembly factor 2 n=1 Tax=Roseobacter sp. TaxID=1907202 RepID=UPI00296620D2|nr:succinate dehydrogenase assembly factor 2 [Roseobacter sp.]MDW3182318.1 succinate dehydrogenase assembly factor 2 [Roseobacter sp.]